MNIHEQQTDRRDSCICPLCDSSETDVFGRRTDRVFRKCTGCDLIFVPGEFHLTPDKELAHYRNHQNRLDDPDYRTFLNRLARPVSEQLRHPSQGLDYGCGPVPVLADLLSALGHDVKGFDPWFAPAPELCEQTFDFVVCSETAEHFRCPSVDFGILRRLLRPGGWLGIMTQRPPVSDSPSQSFLNWYYQRDPTHVAFYSERTFQWIADLWNARLQIVSDSVVLLQAPGGAH
ncbi:MAG: class I SAM-dependent methyltransferase [Planctomycetaceae bacterium]|nr:class I SAM-dependent methyltransferase [Planctomycetaceae bacterium]